MNQSTCPNCGSPAHPTGGRVWCSSPSCDWSLALFPEAETKAVEDTEHAREAEYQKIPRGQGDFERFTGQRMEAIDQGQERDAESFRQKYNISKEEFDSMRESKGVTSQEWHDDLVAHSEGHHSDVHHPSEENTLRPDLTDEQRDYVEKRRLDIQKGSRDTSPSAFEEQKALPDAPPSGDPHPDARHETLDAAHGKWKQEVEKRKLSGEPGFEDPKDPPIPGEELKALPPQEERMGHNDDIGYHREFAVHLDDQGRRHRVPGGGKSEFTSQEVPDSPEYKEREEEHRGRPTADRYSQPQKALPPRRQRVGATNDAYRMDEEPHPDHPDRTRAVFPVKDPVERDDNTNSPESVEYEEEFERDRETADRYGQPEKALPPRATRLRGNRFVEPSPNPATRNMLGDGFEVTETQGEKDPYLNEPDSPDYQERVEEHRGRPTADSYHKKDAMSAYNETAGGALVPPALSALYPGYPAKPKPPRVKKKSFRDKEGEIRFRKEAEESKATAKLAARLNREEGYHEPTEMVGNASRRRAIQQERLADELGDEKVLPTPEERKHEWGRFDGRTARPDLTHGQGAGEDKMDAAVIQAARRESSDYEDERARQGLPPSEPDDIRLDKGISKYPYADNPVPGDPDKDPILKFNRDDVIDLHDRNAELDKLPADQRPAWMDANRNPMPRQKAAPTAHPTTHDEDDKPVEIGMQELPTIEEVDAGFYEHQEHMERQANQAKLPADQREDWIDPNRWKMPEQKGVNPPATAEEAERTSYLPSTEETAANGFAPEQTEQERRQRVRNKWDRVSQIESRKIEEESRQKKIKSLRAKYKSGIDRVKESSEDWNVELGRDFRKEEARRALGRGTPEQSIARDVRPRNLPGQVPNAPGFVNTDQGDDSTYDEPDEKGIKSQVDDEKLGNEPAFIYDQDHGLIDNPVPLENDNTARGSRGVGTQTTPGESGRIAHPVHPHDRQLRRTKSQADDEKISQESGEDWVDPDPNEPGISDYTRRDMRGQISLEEQRTEGKIPRAERPYNRPKTKSLDMKRIKSLLQGNIKGTYGNYSGRLTDALGRTMCFSGGRHVPCNNPQEPEKRPIRKAKIPTRNPKMTPLEEEEGTQTSTGGAPLPQEQMGRPGSPDSGAFQADVQRASGSPLQSMTIKLGTQDQIIGYGTLTPDGNIQWEGNLEAVQSVLSSLDPALQGQQLLEFLVNDSIDRWWATPSEDEPQEERPDAGQNFY